MDSAFVIIHCLLTPIVRCALKKKQTIKTDKTKKQTVLEIRLLYKLIALFSFRERRWTILYLPWNGSKLECLKMCVRRKVIRSIA